MSGEPWPMNGCCCHIRMWTARRSRGTSPASRHPISSLCRCVADPVLPDVMDSMQTVGSSRCDRHSMWVTCWSEVRMEFFGKVSPTTRVDCSPVEIRDPQRLEQRRAGQQVELLPRRLTQQPSDNLRGGAAVLEQCAPRLHDRASEDVADRVRRPTHCVFVIPEVAVLAVFLVPGEPHASWSANATT